jgi:hypothetical protein
MHPAQRRALIAMLDSVEQQVKAVKALLLSDIEAAVAAVSPQGAPPLKHGYLSEDEEDNLAKELERERQAALAEHQKAFERLQKLGELDE